MVNANVSGKKGGEGKLGYELPIKKFIKLLYKKYVTPEATAKVAATEIFNRIEDESYEELYHKYESPLIEIDKCIENESYGELYRSNEVPPIEIDKCIEDTFTIKYIDNDNKEKRVQELPFNRLKGYIYEIRKQ